MKILGIDTSTKILALGAYDGSKIYEYNLETGRKLSSLLAPTIQRVIRALGWRAQDIDCFACGLGPGSFTGLRIGMALIKGIAWSQGAPVIGISTLDILARNAKLKNGYLVPVIDAKRNLIYSGFYRVRQGVCSKVSKYMLLNSEDLVKKAKSGSLFLGDALSLHSEAIMSNNKDAVIMGEDYWYPRGRHIIDLALERLRKKKFTDAAKIRPIYLYPKDCQVRQR
ncbi:tRNA (adenosine(37)-N6)-threonylcarbamoyltransferase complex dimerization subunit type 1 TsaB [Candidatus Omnitrophota bacterium]